MEYELSRDWKYTGGPEDAPGGSVLLEGTKLGRIEINEGVPMTPQMLADALQRKLAREVNEPPPKPKAPVTGKAKPKVVDDA